MSMMDVCHSGDENQLLNVNFIETPHNPCEDSDSFVGGNGKTSNKNRKKKEKEKMKKATIAAAAAAATSVEMKEESGTEAKKNESKKDGKAATEKKVPKHVREMQETLARRKEAEERKKREEEERLKKEEEERLRQEQLERQAEEARLRKKEREKEKLLKKKMEGKILTAKQKELAYKREAMRNQILSNSGGLPLLPLVDAIRPIYQKKKTRPKPKECSIQEKQSQHGTVPELEKVEEDKDDGDEWEEKNWDDAVSKSFVADAHKVVEVEVAKKDVEVEYKKNQSNVEVEDKMNNEDSALLRSPICCIMGHVDAGKTKLLDCIRGTRVQEGEAGGISQQIGATYFPADCIRERTKQLKADAKLNVPGLLVIDTPGHESFANLRSRGSGLCDIAILVVDIMHGLEPQTIESLNLLKMRNTEFIVALNKVDRLYGWKTCRNAPIVKTMKQQSKDVQNEFNMRLTQIITQLKEQGLNAELYYKNRERGETYNIVPTSAISGEGVPDLLLLLVQWAQKTMVEKLTYSDEMQCTVLDVKVIEGYGTTIDVVLSNGFLHEGDKIVVCGMQGPIVTTIRALLTPHPMKELRIKGMYLHHKQIKAAQGIKIIAQGLEHAVAGTDLYVVRPEDDLENIKEAAMEDMKSVLSRIDKSGEGVCVQASTIGSLEALLAYLKSPQVNIPVRGIGIGPVHKKDVMKANAMLEKKKEYATILGFDVKVTSEARQLADELGINVFSSDIIYHLCDQFKAYVNNLKEQKKKEAVDEAVFPCVLKILPNCIYNKKDPVVLGVDVLEGIAKVGTPICIPQREFINIGRITSIKNNLEPVDIAKKGQKVSIKIVGSNPEEQQKMFGRHFEIEDELVSRISRKSIDALKECYRDDLTKEEWKLVVKLKSFFKIQ